MTRAIRWFFVPFTIGMWLLAVYAVLSPSTLGLGPAMVLLGVWLAVSLLLALVKVIVA